MEQSYKANKVRMVEILNTMSYLPVPLARGRLAILLDLNLFLDESDNVSVEFCRSYQI